MPISRRVAHQESLTMKQVAKMILVTYGQPLTAAQIRQPNPKFKLQETVIQNMLGMPLSDKDRKRLVRELNLFGWQVAINIDYWLMFCVNDLHTWHDAGQLPNRSLFNTLLKNPQPEAFGLIGSLNIEPNEVAKFNHYSDIEIIEAIAERRYDRYSDEAIDEFEATGDGSVLGIEEDQQLPVDHFTFWQYVDYFLVKKGLIHDIG